MEALWPSATAEQWAGGLGVGDVHVWWLDLARPAYPLERLEAWLDASELDRASRFRSELHRSRYVAAHGQMRALLGTYTGAAAPAIHLVEAEHGKPRLHPASPIAPGQPQIEFNLSHSGDQGLIAVGRGVSLGADIEVEHSIPDLLGLARAHFTNSELQDLLSLHVARRHEGFFAAWTRKEAYVKALGAGLSVPLDSFEVSLLPDASPGFRSIGGSMEAASAWTLWADRPTLNSWAAVAVHRPLAKVRAFSLRSMGTP